MSNVAAQGSQIVVVGGCGRVGLPLALAFAERGMSVVSYDIDIAAVDTVNAGKMPFRETNADETLSRVLAAGSFKASADAAVVARAEYVIVVIGTPVDQYLNPDPESIPRALEPILAYLSDGQLIVLRSTVYPGVTASLEGKLRDHGLTIGVAFCPERLSQGQALEELTELPQIVSSRTKEHADRAAILFRVLNDDIVFLDPEEAELAKLFTNTWRYIRFAIANQLFMIANDYGLDYERIRAAMRHNYPRALDLPGAGFAAGPCLLKDTAQLAAFNDNKFTLGNAATLINEGLPNYVVAHLQTAHNLSTMTVGILGMAFKGDSDDTRSSLSYKLKRILSFKAGRVMCTDPYVTSDPDLYSLDRVLSECDLLIVGAPHTNYRSIVTEKPLVDIWNLLGRGVIV